MSERSQGQDGVTETLRDYMRRRGLPPEGPFEPKAMYFKHGDFLYVFFEDADYCHESHGPNMELLRALSDRQIIGVKLHRFSEVMRATREGYAG